MRIVKQIFLLTMLIKKQNLYLVWASKYLQHFNLNVHHKYNKQHIVSDVLSCLVLIMSSETNIKKDKLHVLFIKIYTEMSDEFWKHLVEDYDEDLTWHYIIDVLNKNKSIDVLDKNKSDEYIIILLFKWESNNII